MDEKIPVKRLAELAGMTPRSMQLLIADGTLPKAEKGGLPTWDAIKALLAHFRSRIAGDSYQRVADKARRERAEADEAEVRAALAIGDCVSVADAKEFMSDFIIQVRQIIEGAEMSAGERERVSKALKGIKLGAASAGNKSEQVGRRVRK